MAPIYSFRRESEALFCEEIKGYAYPQYFYLPTSTLHRPFEEGFVRLDRVQAIERSWLQNIPLVLTDSVCGLLRKWFRVYLGEPVESVDADLNEYRVNALAELRSNLA